MIVRFFTNPRKIEAYKQKLESLMTEQQAFLIHGCNLKDVAAALSMPRHHLSIIINSEYRVNFNDFINKYRVEFLKVKMLEPESQQLTLDGLAKEAGFSSRATFSGPLPNLQAKRPQIFSKKLQNQPKTAITCFILQNETYHCLQNFVWEIG